MKGSSGISISADVEDIHLLDTVGDSPTTQFHAVRTMSTEFIVNSWGLSLGESLTRQTYCLSGPRQTASPNGRLEALYTGQHICELHVLKNNDNRVLIEFGNLTQSTPTHCPKDSRAIILQCQPMAPPSAATCCPHHH